jgi:hypothetical protein
MARRPIVTTKEENQKRAKSGLLFVAKELPEGRPNPDKKKPPSILFAVPIVVAIEFLFAAAITNSGQIPPESWGGTTIVVGVLGLMIAMLIGAGGTRDPRETPSRHGWMLSTKPEDTYRVHRFMTQNMRESTRHFVILALGSVIVIGIGVTLSNLLS